MRKISEETRKKNAERAKQWREEHPDYQKDYMKKYREENGDEMRANDRQYHADHREEKNLKRRQWAKDNPEQDKAASDAWRAANPKKVKEAYLKRKYGITLVDYEALLIKQGGGCAICGGPPGGQSNGIYYSVDHDHATNKIRGLLCHNHNTGLGLLGDDIVSLQKALDYLVKSSSIPENTMAADVSQIVPPT